MGKAQGLIDEATKHFIETQRMFFVATAPLDANGHVNLSPKGLDSIRILAPDTIAYLDLTGSGVETIAHIRENGRLVLMFCAFEGPPKIVRVHGRGRVVEADTPEFSALEGHFEVLEGTRSIIVIKVQRVSDSCGFAVPLMKYEKDRQQLLAWAEQKGPEGLQKYRAEKNRSSLDGLPGVSA
jgi:Pyridoxamine 5'-phosphate oxidase